MIIDRNDIESFCSSYCRYRAASEPYAIVDGVDAVQRYRSGEKIEEGDHVLFHGKPALVELVAFDPNQPEHASYVQEFGGGVLISDPMCSGRTFISRESLPEYEDLEFVSRSGQVNE